MADRTAEIRVPDPRGAPDLLPARMVNEYVYCPRLAYLEWVQGEWDDNSDTVQGKFVHRRVDTESRADLPAPDKGDKEDSGKGDETATTGAAGLPKSQEGDKEDSGKGEETPITTQSLLLSSEDLGVIARIDLLEVEGKTAVPVDYKKGTLPDTEAGAHDPERVQLCLQGLILRDNGYECTGGVLYFAASRRRVEIPFDDELIRMTREAARGLRALANASRLPLPLVDSPKCIRCSLAGICLPDEINRLAHPETDAEVRRLVPGRDDRLPLYVQEQGTYIGKKGERLTITLKGKGIDEARLMELSHLALFGNVQVSTQAVRELCNREIPISYLSQGGWFYGMTTGLGHKNIELRIAQHRSVENGANFPIARSIVSGKIYNQRILLRRNLPTPDRRLLGRLALYVRQARHSAAPESLLGTEGIAAHDYFGAFGGLLRGAGEWAGSVFSENGRNRRPPLDEVNAVLSFLYAVLVKECTLALTAVGFDIYRGFYHTPKYGRPALSLDLCEEFRPLVADSVCITLFNQGEFSAGDFIRRARGVTMLPKARKAVLAGYERRLNQMVTHPVFGYTISYRRIIELQARLLRAVVMGELESYRPFSTR